VDVSSLTAGKTVLFVIVIFPVKIISTTIKRGNGEIFLKTLYIDNGIKTIRLARVEDGVLAELYFENRENESLVGNIYAAAVKNILPARFAFLDIGAKKDAFLNLDDKKQRHLYNTDGTGAKKLSLKKGSTVLVQVVRDETTAKGAYVTTQLTFTGRYFVLVKNGMADSGDFIQRSDAHLLSGGGAGISQKITEPSERERLKKAALKHLPKTYGVIIRTEAAGCDEDTLQEELRELITKCEDILSRGLNVKPPYCVQKEKSLLVKSADAMLTKDIDRIIINYMEDDFREYLKTVYGGVLSKLEIFNESPLAGEPPLNENIADRWTPKSETLSAAGLPQNESFSAVKLPQNENLSAEELPQSENLPAARPQNENGALRMFEYYSIEDRIIKALNKKVWLKSGGFIVIEQTEACTVIDVNSGRFIYGGSRAKTISKTNYEAAEEIARQIRLKNLSGMVIIDFINPENAAETDALAETLKNALKNDRIPVKLTCITDFGVFILTRKKIREPVEAILTEPCGLCGGAGRIRRNFYE